MKKFAFAFAVGAGALLVGCVNGLMPTIISPSSSPTPGWIVEPAPPNQEAHIDILLGEKSRLVATLDPPYRGADADGTIYSGDALDLVGVGTATEIGGWDDTRTYSIGASARWADSKTVEFDFPRPSRLIRVRIVDSKGRKAVSAFLARINPRYLGVRFGDLIIDPASGSPQALGSLDLGLD